MRPKTCTWNPHGWGVVTIEATMADERAGNVPF